MKYFITGDAGGLYSAPHTIPGGSLQDSVPLPKSDCQVIYDIYDALAKQYPEYVQKQTMGQVFGKDFNRYTFRPCPMENTSDFAHTPFKVCIVTSIHGYEQGCGWTAAHFFRLLCENEKDPHLAFLRRNILFDVIPVANPWGFSQNKRCNGNGVDLNRNFAPGFIYDMDTASKYWGGTAPCSEEETRLLMAFIQENKDAQVVLDYHNISKGYPLFYVYEEEDVQLAYSVFAALSDKWKAEYPQFPQKEFLGRVKPNGGEGMFADYLRTENLWVLTMETPWTMPIIGAEQYDAPTIRCALDVLANTLLTILRSYR